MTDEEKNDSNKEKNNLKEKNSSLSPTDWIMLLSSEINNCMVLFMMVGVLTASSLLVIIGIMVKILGSALSYLFIIFGLYLCLCFFIGYHWFQKRVKPLINTREAIISDELTDFSEIHRKWNEYIKKYYGKLLEKSEMDEEKEKIKEGGEKSGEMVLEKGIKEHKEVLKVHQSDIKDIKESLQEIRGLVEGTSKFSSWCVLGGVGIAAGFGIMGISVSFSSLSLKIWGLFFGYVLFLAGMFMIKGAYYAGTDLKKYPDKFELYYMKHLTELRHTNKWLFRGFSLVVLDILS
jgi:F0F1-type ATP synthase membrane subunit b/b'